MKNLNERENELVYFALSRLLDDFNVDGIQTENDQDEVNQIIDLREKFAKAIADKMVKNGEVIK